MKIMVIDVRGWKDTGRELTSGGTARYLRVSVDFT